MLAFRGGTRAGDEGPELWSLAQAAVNTSLPLSGSYRGYYLGCLRIVPSTS